MHRPTLESGTLKSVAHVVSATSILFCIHGLFTDYELFSVIFAGFDLLHGVYLVGIIVAIITSISLMFGWPKIEYVCMSISVWMYALIFMFSALVTSLHSPIIVICFGLAMINVVLATHIKKGEIDGEKDISGSPESAD